MYLWFIFLISGTALQHLTCVKTRKPWGGDSPEGMPIWAWHDEKGLAVVERGVVLSAAYLVYWACLLDYYLRPVKMRGGGGVAVNKHCKSNFTLWHTGAQTALCWEPFTDYDKIERGILSWGPEMACLHLWWASWNKGLVLVPTGSILAGWAHVRSPHLQNSKMYFEHVCKGLKFYIMQERGRAREIWGFAIVVRLVSPGRWGLGKHYMVIIFHHTGISFSGMFCILVFEFNTQ